MKLWNELPTKLRVLPKSLFKIVLFNILESCKGKVKFILQGGPFSNEADIQRGPGLKI